MLMRQEKRSLSRKSAASTATKRAISAKTASNGKILFSQNLGASLAADPTIAEIETGIANEDAGEVTRGIEAGAGTEHVMAGGAIVTMTDGEGVAVATAATAGTEDGGDPLPHGPTIVETTAGETTEET